MPTGTAPPSTRAAFDRLWLSNAARIASAPNALPLTLATFLPAAVTLGAVVLVLAVLYVSYRLVVAWPLGVPDPIPVGVVLTVAARSLRAVMP